MSMWLVLLVVFVAGAVGGLVNALLSDNKSWKPRPMGGDDMKITTPGWLVTAFIGGVAACVSWGLYGPFAAYWLMGGPPGPTDLRPGITLSALVGSILVGIGGSRWLTNEVDKTLLRGAAVKAAKTPASPNLAEVMAILSPAKAFQKASE